MHELRQHQWLQLSLLVWSLPVWRGHSYPRGFDRARVGTGVSPVQAERSSAGFDMKREVQFVICVGNKGYAASLESRKIYQVLQDKAGLKHHQIRVIDESGEDYLYPEELFVAVKLPQAVEQAVRRATA